MALCLGCRVGDKILIGDDIEILVVKAGGHWLKLQITAPNDVTILREKLVEKAPPRK